MDNTADIDYFKNPPFDTKFGETAFKEKLPSILESHENELKKKLIFNTIADLQSYTGFDVGDIVEVLGYYSKGVSGHFGKIESTNKGGVPVGTNFCNPIPLFNGEVLADWYGTKNDGTDDSAYFLKAIANNKCVSCNPNKEYKLSLIQLNNSSIIDCKNAIIKPFSNNYIFSHANDSKIKNPNFIGSGKNSGNLNEVCIILNDKLNTETCGVSAEEVSGTVIAVNSCINNLFTARNFYGITIKNCNKGIFFNERGEYCNLTGFTISKTNEALSITAGNINASGGCITECVKGLVINAGDNDSHGIIGNIQINHCDYPLIINKINSKAMNINNLNIYYGTIHLNECEGITISNSEMAQITILEEGAKNCYFKNNNFGDNIVVTPNYNSKPSKVIYDNLIDKNSGAVGISNLKGGYLLLKNFVPFSGSIPAGGQQTVINPIIANNSISKNLNYTVDNFYNQSSDILEFGSKRIIDDWSLDVLISFNFYSTTNFDGNDIEICLRNDESNIDIYIPYTNRINAGSNFIKCYNLNATILKTNYYLTVKNNSGVTINMATDQPNDKIYNRLLASRI